ncbi:helix-turn-helix domain-containing protein [Sphingomonas sp. MMS12-HWE2-04]|uniref:winged helix-turn-helix domain-containing protein n=1 Tax=Sphingomonas sp. MMS12-HWE2-04 TaxID=3234199 RepID=UPI00384DBE3D
MLGEIRRAVSAPEGRDAAPPFGALIGAQREELVGLVLAALDSAPKARANHDTYMTALVRRPDEGYRLGRRRIALTDTERNVLDMLWNAMPEPVSRSTIHEALYAHGNKPSAGAIDVFVSKLRQKLKLASGGTEFVELIRGKGWALKPELTRAGDMPAEAEMRRSA